jgi:putative oxidoreductase
MIIIGWQTRHAALALAGFTVLASVLFHLTPEGMQVFLKNLSVAGGFLMLFAAGPGRWSLDRG